MTSILKVDQIQLANGSTPTAGDLGLNDTGTVLQVQTVVNRNSATNSGSSIFTNSGLYVDFTPKKSDSTIIVHAQSHVYRNALGHNFHRVINQSTGTASGNRGGRDANGVYHESVPIVWKDTSHNSTAQRRYEIQFADRDNSGSASLYFNDGGGYESGITVFEIAG